MTFIFIARRYASAVGYMPSSYVCHADTVKTYIKTFKRRIAQRHTIEQGVCWCQISGQNSIEVRLSRTGATNAGAWGGLKSATF